MEAYISITLTGALIKRLYEKGVLSAEDVRDIFDAASLGLLYTETEMPNRKQEVEKLRHFLQGVRGAYS